MNACARLAEDETPLWCDAEREPEASDIEEQTQADPCEGVEEFEVADAESSCDSLQLYLRDLQKTKLLSAEEEKELALRIEEGDRAARDRMVLSNLRLVVSIAKRYLNRGLPFLDLVEEGNLGLMKAVGRFDVSRGFRFSTYATWWIRQTIERALMNHSHTIRIPVHVAEEVAKLYRVSYRLRRQLNRDPSLDELADGLGVEVSQVRHLLVLTEKTYSLDQPMGENGEFSLGETLMDATVSPEDRVEGVKGYELVMSLMESFSEAEKKILTLRFGLHNNEPQTLETIGRHFGVTRERVRQIECRSLTKLRKLMEAGDRALACV